MPEVNKQESLIEFPCHFTLKIVGVNVPEFHSTICSIARQYDVGFDESQNRSRLGKTEKYCSLSIRVYVTEKATLDQIYQALTRCEFIKWVL